MLDKSYYHEWLNSHITKEVLSKIQSMNRDYKDCFTNVSNEATLNLMHEVKGYNEALDDVLHMLNSQDK